MPIERAKRQTKVPEKRSNCEIDFTFVSNAFSLLSPFSLSLPIHIGSKPIKVDRYFTLKQQCLKIQNRCWSLSKRDTRSDGLCERISLFLSFDLERRKFQIEISNGNAEAFAFIFIGLKPLRRKINEANLYNYLQRVRRTMLLFCFVDDEHFSEFVRFEKMRSSHSEIVRFLPLVLYFRRSKFVFLCKQLISFLQEFYS